MRRALPLLLFLISILFVGCSEKAVFHPRRPKYYDSIVSLSPSTTEIVMSNADSRALKGRTASCNWPKNMLNAVPIVASVKPDYEKIAAIHPKLIVYDKGLYSDQDIDKLKSTGAELFSIDANSIDDFIKQLYILGSMLAYETRFNDYIERIRLEKNAAMAAPFSTVPKVAIMMPSAGGADYIAGTDSFLADVIKIAGGQLVGPKDSKFSALNAEAFVALNPDVIIVNGSKADTSGASLVLNDPRFKSIKAVKDQNVQILDSDVLLRRGQRVDNLIKDLHYVIAPKQSPNK